VMFSDWLASSESESESRSERSERSPGRIRLFDGDTRCMAGAENAVCKPAGLFGVWVGIAGSVSSLPIGCLLSE